MGISAAKAQPITIPYRYTPRWYQEGLFNCVANGYKRGVAVWHRRAGKDKTMLNIVAKEMFKRVGTYFYFLPTYQQGKKIIWKGIDKDGFRYIDHIPKQVRKSINNTEMTIEAVNGSIFQVVGSDNIDSIVGTNPIGCVYSEYSIQNPDAWNYIRPILMENGGWAIFNYTPRGHNHGYLLYKMALKNPKWFCELYDIQATRVLTEEDIQEERDSGMSEEMIRQEYYCSFEATMPGAYYGEEVMMARRQRRVCPIPYDAYRPVHTAWDMGAGKSDDMVIWFFQLDGFMIKFIDLYWNHSKGLAHYKNIMDERGYKYGTHLGPHDIERPQHTGGENIKTIREIAEDVGLSFVKVPVVPDIRVGIEFVRSKFSNFYFDSTLCEHGVSALASYRRDWDAKNGIFRLAPVHDWSSHFADAIRTAACGIDLIEDPSNATILSPYGSYDEMRNRMIRGRDQEYGGNNEPRTVEEWIKMGGDYY
jgi:phage terminase large subunit